MTPPTPSADAHPTPCAKASRRTWLGGAAALAAAGFGGLAEAFGAQPRRGATPPPAAVLLRRQRLDELAERFHEVFNEGHVLAPYSRERFAARHDVELRPIRTFTRLPGSGERVEVTGLLATPAGLRGELPVVSWQHGTILSFDQVPSGMLRLADPDYQPRDNVDSLETLFNLHRLAAQGFVVIAADYVGKGPLRHGRGEAYAVRETTVRCCRDVLDAGLAMLPELGIRRSALLLNGWSQGGLNAQWLALELHRRGVRVDALAAQSPFNALPDSMRYWCGGLHFAQTGAAAYPPPPAWIAPCLVVLLGSYRAAYGLHDLFDTAIQPQHRRFAEDFWRDYRLDAAALHDMPAGSELLVPGFFERFTAESNSRMLELLARNSTSGSRFDFPTTFYYGLADEALPPELVRPAVAAGGPKVRAAPVARASHRVTFLASLYGGDALAGATPVPEWFQALSRRA